MRRLIIITLVSLALCLTLCIFSLLSVTRFADRARSLRSEAILAMEAGDVQQAEVTLVALAAHLKEHQSLLETFCGHEDLHSLKGEIIDARASIEYGIEDDFYQAIYRAGELMEHIAESQKLSLRNLL